MRLLHLVISPVRIEQILFDATLTSRLPAAFKRHRNIQTQLYRCQFMETINIVTLPIHYAASMS